MYIARSHSQSEELATLPPSIQNPVLTEEDIVRLDKLGIPPEKREEFVQNISILLYSVLDTLFHDEFETGD